MQNTSAPVPRTIRVLRIILWIQIALGALLVVAAQVSISNKAERGFWRGFQDRLAATTSAPSLEEFRPFHAGEVTGTVFFQLLFVVGTLWAIKKGRFLTGVLCTLFLIFATFGQGGFPLLSIAAFILLCRGSSQRWLKAKKQGVPPVLS